MCFKIWSSVINSVVLCCCGVYMYIVYVAEVRLELNLILCSSKRPLHFHSVLSGFLLLFTKLIRFFFFAARYLSIARVCLSIWLCANRGGRDRFSASLNTWSATDFCCCCPSLCCGWSECVFTSIIVERARVWALGERFGWRISHFVSAGFSIRCIFVDTPIYPRRKSVKPEQDQQQTEE